MSAQLGLRNRVDEQGLHMSGRNRKQGWQHAKLSGHALEDKLASRLREDVEFSAELHRKCFGESSPEHPDVTCGGISAGKVDSVIGGKTPAKTDLKVDWPSGRSAKLSVKKSGGGQVWLIGLDRFFAAFEAQFPGRVIPRDVRDGMRLFIGRLPRLEMDQILAGRDPLGPTSKRYESAKNPNGFQEFHQHRFVCETLEQFAPESHGAAMNWLRNNVAEIADLCFARGLCANAADQAEFVWYYIEPETEGHRACSKIISISLIIQASKAVAPPNRVIRGARNGGSTLLLPFGFLQMHQGQMQFHHGYGSLSEALKRLAAAGE